MTYDMEHFDCESRSETFFERFLQYRDFKTLPATLKSIKSLQ